VHRRSRDIRRQIRKLSQITSIFARFLPSQVLKRWCALKVVPDLSSPPRSTSCEKVSRGYSHYRQNYRHAFTKFWANFWPTFKKSIGDPRPHWGVLARLGHSLACVKIWGAAPLIGQNMVFRNSWFRWVHFHRLISVISKPIFTELVSPNVKGIGVQNVLVRFLISSSVPEIFAVKLWSRPKLSQILHVFGH